MPLPADSVLAGHRLSGGLVRPHNPQKLPHCMIRVQAGARTYQVTRKGFPRLTVTAERPAGEFCAASPPGGPETGPAVRAHLSKRRPATSLTPRRMPPVYDEL